jgi:hypothetical protein
MSENMQNTLFRFISYRSPQLAQEGNKELNFIFDKRASSGSASNRSNSSVTTSCGFLNAVRLKGKCSKWSAMQTYALKNRTHFVQSEQQLKDDFGSLYELTNTLFSKRSELTEDEIYSLIIDDSSSSARLICEEFYSNETNFDKLWDNIYFQVITQNNFYLKESLFQLLITLNFLKYVHQNFNLNSGKGDFYFTLLNATVVLSEELFSESKVVPVTTEIALSGVMSLGIDNLGSEEEYPNQEYPNSFMQKKLAVEVAQLIINQSTTAIKELEQLIQKDVSFSLNYTLSTEAYFALFRVAEIPKIKSFQQAIDILKNRIDEENRIILNSTLFSESLVNISGVLISVQNLNQEVLPENSLRFAMISTPREHNKVQFILSIAGLPNDVFVIKASYQTTNQTTKSNSFKKVNTSSIILFPDDKALSTNLIEDHLIISGELSLSNNKTYQFVINVFEDGSQGVDKITNRLPLIGSGLLNQIKTNLVIRNPVSYANEVFGEVESFGEVAEGSSSSGNGTSGTFTSGSKEPPVEKEKTTNNNVAFVPNKFGFRQLGIAEYKKVEQSVRCYVPGEVSHIENIMAREYKDKTTRRLQKTENTDTTSSETEKERLTDTSTTNRFEMQNEISNVIQQSKDFSAFANVHGDFGMIKFDAGAAFATHTSKEESTRQAVTQAQEITNRALDRIVQKVKEERVRKVTEEYEETNRHGFDNRDSNQHVVGVYRWVDKIYKNQIWNYGKRLMYEFMIPQPSKLHRLALLEQTNNGFLDTIVKPIDPRTSTSFKLENYSALEDETILKFWTGKYNVTFNPRPLDNITIGKAFSFTIADTNGPAEYDEVSAQHAEIEVPEGYVGVLGKGKYNDAGLGEHRDRRMIISNISVQNDDISIPLNNATKVPVSYSSHGTHTGSVNFIIECKLTPEAIAKWQQDTFNKIIEAYEQALRDYNAQTDSQSKTRESNPLFYRDIEQLVLRKNCISYLIDRNPNGNKRYGQGMYAPEKNPKLNDYEVNLDQKMDDYGSFVKFIEQAFEWKEMSYNFYPFYWGAKNDWAELYQFESNDPTFREFMQAGMARVILTIRPGFEAAVMHYINTGQIWNGGQIPILGDPLYVSILDELKDIKPKKEGKAWETRVPTSLTILQAETIGLKVKKALPCNCDDKNDFENPSSITCSDDEFYIAKADEYVEFSYIGFDIAHRAMYDFPAKFNCCGQEINIQWDASWDTAFYLDKLYTKLAEEISLIKGIKAKYYSLNENAFGITFSINPSLIEIFVLDKFVQGRLDEMMDRLRLVFSEDSFVVTNPTNYVADRVLDKNKVNLPETTSPYPITLIQL